LAHCPATEDKKLILLITIPIFTANIKMKSFHQLYFRFFFIYI